MGNEWTICDGVTDSENTSDRVVCKVQDSSIELAYVNVGVITTLTLEGVFETCRMQETGHTAEQLKDILMPGCIAVPVYYGMTKVVLIIDADYNVSTLDEEDVVPKDVQAVDITEYDNYEDADETIRNALDVL